MSDLQQIRDALEYACDNADHRYESDMYDKAIATLTRMIETPAPTENSFCGIKIIEDKSLDENEIRIYVQDKLKARLKLQSGETEKVDLNALKLEVEKCFPSMNYTESSLVDVVIDHLANTGRLR